MSEEKNINKILGRTQEWDREEITRLSSEAAALRADLEHTLGLLAVLHGDGGHYTGKHGMEKSCEDAKKMFHALRADLARVEGERDAAHKEVVRLRHGLNQIAWPGAFGINSEQSTSEMFRHIAQDTLAISTPVCNERVASREQLPPSEYHKAISDLASAKAEVERVNTELAKVGCSDGYFRATVAALEVAADTPGVSVEHRRQFLASMIAELAHAYRKHGARPWSRHEFYAVMREEVDEVWDAIKTDQPITEVLKEAMQIAAVCLRYAETEDAYRGSHPLPLPTRAALAPTPPAQQQEKPRED